LLAIIRIDGKASSSFYLKEEEEDGIPSAMREGDSWKWKLSSR
jgi:hypothetical protein